MLFDKCFEQILPSIIIWVREIEFFKEELLALRSVKKPWSVRTADDCNSVFRH